MKMVIWHITTHFIVKGHILAVILPGTWLYGLNARTGRLAISIL